MEQIFVWGTGKIADEILGKCTSLHAYRILAIIDNDVEKWGKRFHGIEICSPEVLKNYSNRVVILTNAYEEIYQQIINSYPHLKNMIEDKYYFFRQSIYKRYEKTTDEEMIQVLKNIKENGLEVFNYEFVDKYKNVEVEIAYDNRCHLFYVWHNKKKLYFSKEYSTEERVLEYYKSILLEQDKESPHRYLSEEFDVEDGDVVVDIGVAEGNFSLEIIDRVKKLYIIDADANWIEALKETFKNYDDKVVIIQGFISAYDEGEVMSLDTIIQEPVNFIKMDIEGNELDALHGAQKLISRSEKLRMAICCYHNDYDQNVIENFMNEHKIAHDTSKGYMWFPFNSKQNYISTKLNRGIVRGIK